MKKQMVPVALGLATVWSASELIGHSNLVYAATDSRTFSRENLSAYNPMVHGSMTPTSAINAKDGSLANMPVEEEVQPMISRTTSHSTDAIVLSFEPPANLAPASTPSVSPSHNSLDWPQSTPVQSAPKPTQQAMAKNSSIDEVDNNQDLFTGGSESLVARTVGAAEGTRNPDGSKTTIYEGHIDPGNGVWNRGTFSYQFGNTENLSPEEADRRQIAKIQRIYESVMLPKAKQHEVTPLTLMEELNGIDLINQAPLAVTEADGYIERLAEVKKRGLQGEEAILEARVWAFWDSAKGGWDAPGLRAYDDLGKEASIRHDQKRRMKMIDAALTAYQQQNDAPAHAHFPKADEKQLASVSPSLSESTTNRETNNKAETMADLIIAQALPVSRGSHIAIAP